jgi:DNA polymerase-3 subunit gamma/tau
VAIREGTHVDVVEIDAASHGGVDDARELREKAPTAAMAGREKVYIIDEAQRLSREAFDALLKLFEEPPPGVRFVLATTEPHKMPATIVGRCQRFDFRRLTLEDLSAHLVKIAGEEGVALDTATAHAIARQAEGSARDALSLLDQATVLGGATVGEDTVRALLGAPKAEVQHELADVVAVGDVRGAFEVVSRLVHEGHDLRNVTGEALGHFRDLLLIQSAPGQEDLLDIPGDGYEALRMQAEKFTPGELARVIGLLLAAQNDMRWTTSPRLTLELALVRACVPETDPTPAGVVARLERLERLANLTPRAQVIDQTSPPPAETSPQAEAPAAAAQKRSEASAERSGAETSRSSQGATTPPEPPDQLPVPHAASAGSVDVALLRRSWPALMDHLGQLRQPLLRAALDSATVATYDGQTLELALPPGKHRVAVAKVAERQEGLQQALQDLFGIRPNVVCIVRESRDPAGVPEVQIVEEEDTPDEAEALRRVQEMLGAKPVEG